jgi:hypothetical protein
MSGESPSLASRWSPGAVALDLLAYAGWVQTTLTPPSGLTIAIDAVFLSFAAAVLLVARRPGYRPVFKYIVVTLDFAIIAIVVTLDPSIARGGAAGDWSSLVALLFIFWLNLLRFSIGATAYAAALALALFITFGWLAPPHPNELGAMTAGLVMLLLIGLSLTRSNRAMLEEATTKQMMERYLPPQLVGRLFSGGASLEPGGEARTVTLLFADIRGFTTIAERLPAEAVVDLLNAALSRLSDAVFAHSGTLDKFTGDGLMAIFGAPVAQPDDAARAVAAGLAMLEAIRDLDASSSPQGRAEARHRRRDPHRRGDRRQHRLGPAPRLHRDRRCGEPRQPRRGPDQGARRPALAQSRDPRRRARRPWRGSAALHRSRRSLCQGSKPARRALHRVALAADVSRAAVIVAALRSGWVGERTDPRDGPEVDLVQALGGAH